MIANRWALLIAAVSSAAAVVEVAAEPEPIPYATLTGHVLADPGGTPIAGATVLYLSAGASIEKGAATTDADGHFRLERIDAKHERDILVQAPGAFPTIWTIGFDEACLYEYDFLIAREPVTHGRVVDLETKLPVADAVIVPWGTGGSDRYGEITRSRADGSFEIMGSPNEWNGLGVEVRKAGFVGSRLEFAEPSDDADGAADQTSVWEMGLMRECVLEGRVMRSDGSPVAGATVGLFQSGDATRTLPRPATPVDIGDVDTWIEPPKLLLGGDSPRFTATTGQNGEYRIGGLCAWMLIDQPRLVTGKTTALGKRPEFSAPGETKRLDWTVPLAFGAIEGRVTVNGEIGEASVAWNFGSFEGRMFELNDDATYRFDDVPAGDVDVYFDLRMNGFDTRVDHVTVTPGATVRRDVAFEFDLRQIRGSVTIRGEPDFETLTPEDVAAKVLRGEMESIDDAFPSIDPTGLRIVATRTRDGLELQTTANADGSFAFVLPDAKWDAWAITVPDARVSNSKSRSVCEKTSSGATSLRLLAWAATHE